MKEWDRLCLFKKVLKTYTDSILNRQNSLKVNDNLGTVS